MFIGGRLNEDLDGEEAVDVRPMLRELRIVPCDTVEQMALGLRDELAAQV